MIFSIVKEFEHINIDAYFIRNNMVGGTNVDKKNVNDVFNKYIHIYKRYEHLCEKYKNSLVFYNYYTKMRDLYKNTIDNFANVDHQIILKFSLKFKNAKIHHVI